MKVVCLASGGMDSSVMMFMLKRKGHEIFPLHVDYGHKAEKMELLSYQKICRLLDLSPEVLEMLGLRKITSGLTSPNIEAKENPFFPSRNLLLLAAGSAYAYSKLINVVAMGILGKSVFPDQTKEFIRNCELTISSSLNNRVKILTPLIDLDKREVIDLAKKYGFPVEITYSCYEGSSQPCGNCGGCKGRQIMDEVRISKNT